MIMRTKEEKAKLIRLWKESGQSIKKWCKQHHIPNTTFHGWIKSSKQNNKIQFSRSDFQAIKNNQDSITMEIRFKKINIKFSGSFDLHILQEFLDALRRF